MNPILKVLGALLTYPDEGLVAAAPEMRDLIDQSELSARDKQSLCALVSELTDSDLLRCQERYVDVFDRGRSTSLHLFEHVHGDSRDRGMAMVELGKKYERAGLTLRPGELPDYVPVVLEYLSIQPEEEMQELLGDCAHILRKIGDALAERNDAHSVVFAALLTLAHEAGLTPAKQREAVPEEKSIDEEWAEEPVIFGPAASPACGAGRQHSAVIRFMPRGTGASPGTRRQ